MGAEPRESLPLFGWGLTLPLRMFLFNIRSASRIPASSHFSTVDGTVAEVALSNELLKSGKRVVNGPSSPTHVRYSVVGVTTLMSFVLYLHRYFLSFIERFIKQDLGLTESEVGVLLSVFFWAYGFGQVPGGWLSDRFGARRMLASYIVLWSILTGLVGVATSFAAILFLRFGCGMAQAGAYPTSATLLSKWSPFPARGVASSFVAAGGRIGGVAAPVLTAYLLVTIVSVDSDSQLQPGDIPDAGRLCENLSTSAAGDESPAARSLLDQLTPQMARKIETKSATEEELRGAFNALLNRRELLEQVRDNDLKLEGEAVKIADIPAADRRDEQIARLNRLVLEATLPDDIKKVYAAGWRPVMFLYCVLGVTIGLAFWWVVRDRPHVHPRVNPAEVSLIDDSRPEHASSPHGDVGRLPLKNFVSNRSLWCSSISQFATVFAHIFIVTWFARFLTDVHQVPVMERAWMVSLPMGGGIVGMMLGGWWTDWFTQRFGIKRGRSWPLAIARLVGMLAFVACLAFPSQWGVTVSLTVMALAVDMGVPAVWAYNQDVGGRFAGSVLGWGNMWGCFAAAVSPIALNAVIENASWDAMFVCCAASLGIASLAALGVDATSPIAPAE